MLFKKQYPGTAGFVSTLLQYKPLPTLLTEGIQIIYCRACHWIAACKKSPAAMSSFTIHHQIQQMMLRQMSSLICLRLKLPRWSLYRNNQQAQIIVVCLSQQCVWHFYLKKPAQLVFDETKIQTHLYECFTKSLIMTPFFHISFT